MRWHVKMRSRHRAARHHAPGCLPTWLGYCVLQGGRPVAISSTVQATLHRSACRPCPVCVITSGAIQ